jgi:hypothetical protein
MKQVRLRVFPCLLRELQNSIRSTFKRKSERFLRILPLEILGLASALSSAGNERQVGARTRARVLRLSRPVGLRFGSPLRLLSMELRQRPSRGRDDYEGSAKWNSTSAPRSVSHARQASSRSEVPRLRSVLFTGTYESTVLAARLQIQGKRVSEGGS